MKQNFDIQKSYNYRQKTNNEPALLALISLTGIYIDKVFSDVGASH